MGEIRNLYKTLVRVPEWKISPVKFRHIELFLGALAKWLCLYVCSSEWINSAPTKQIFIKFDI